MPYLVLINADDYYVPAHKMATVKRFPYFSLSKIWNEAPDLKRNPNKIVKLYSNYMYVTPPPAPPHPWSKKSSKVNNIIVET